ncbi:hypothetical protein T05_126 [Trichinella murrelli]|uniref:Uncharacterized protein n=1 Tax=Trichinella murrelli TaxID=144512 RepID=A0A0V0U5H7_9BILA|nr:hypothetical protein T05_126 [Trichinella murrelli]
MRWIKTGLISSKALVHLTEINSSNCIMHLIQYPIIDGKLEYFIHCIVMEARTCTTMILLFNINCHYERYDFTFNIHMSDKQESHPLQFHTRTFICIHIFLIMNYCFGDGYVCTLLTVKQGQYIITSPSPVKLNRVKMNRNSLGLNLKFLMCFIAKIEKALRGEEMSIGDLEIYLGIWRGGDRFGGEEIDLEGRR